MNNNETKAVAKIDSASPSPTDLLQLAIEKDVDIEKLSKLMDLQERWLKANIEKKFNLAMANFQKNCPIIEKKQAVKNKSGEVRYKFAPIGEIIRQVKTLLADNKLFYDFTTEDSEGFLKVICTATHESGHCKQAAFKIPIGKEDYMSDVQKYGARLTFAKRYAFCNAFGITTAETDTDAQQPKEKTVKLTKDQSSDL